MKEIKNILPEDFHKILTNDEDVQIVDVRIEEGDKICDKEILKFPHNQLDTNVDRIKKTRRKKTIIVCDTGENSYFVVSMLIKVFSYKNVYNLKGGLNAYKEFKKTQS